MKQKKALVLGAGGFIGSYMVDRLKSENYFVRAIDIKYPEFSKTTADEFIIRDLRNIQDVENSLDINDGFDEVYQFAADMGGATYINCGKNDANVLSNSVTINSNVAKSCIKKSAKLIFFPSSACVYKATNNMSSCIEEEVYPAFPDNQYGWEKLFSERMYKSFQENYGINVKIARFHSIVGPKATWTGGKEKAHSALIRKVINVEENGFIDVIGDGTQTRTFLYVEDCIDAVRMLVNSNINEAVNIGSDVLVSINEYIELLKIISNKKFNINYIDGPTGVIGRACSTEKIFKAIGWRQKMDLLKTTTLTYNWIKSQIEEIKKI
jgi:nucleoside-diphosphate-sugar epimerase